MTKEIAASTAADVDGSFILHLNDGSKIGFNITNNKNFIAKHIGSMRNFFAEAKCENQALHRNVLAQIHWMIPYTLKKKRFWPLSNRGNKILASSAGDMSVAVCSCGRLGCLKSLVIRTESEWHYALKWLEDSTTMLIEMTLKPAPK